MVCGRLPGKYNGAYDYQEHGGAYHDQHGLGEEGVVAARLFGRGRLFVGVNAHVFRGLGGSVKTRQTVVVSGVTFYAIDFHGCAVRINYPHFITDTG